MRDNLQLQYWLEQIALFNDETSYEQLFLHYNDRLFNLANSFVKLEEAAEEVAWFRYLSPMCSQHSG